MAVLLEMAGVVGKESVQALLQCCIINNKIAAEFTLCGYQRTGMQCQEQVNKTQKGLQKDKR